MELWHSTIYIRSFEQQCMKDGKRVINVANCNRRFLIIICLHLALRSLCTTVAYISHQVTVGWSCLIHKHFFLGFNELNSQDWALFWQYRSINPKANRFRSLFPVLGTSLIARHLIKSDGWRFLFTFRQEYIYNRINVNTVKDLHCEWGLKIISKLEELLGKLKEFRVSRVV